MQTRRTFIRNAVSTIALTGLSSAHISAAEKRPSSLLPWYRRTLRWGQTNITEADPPRYDQTSEKWG
jgi:hypothetical protein